MRHLKEVLSFAVRRSLPRLDSKNRPRAEASPYFRHLGGAFAALKFLQHQFNLVLALQCPKLVLQ
jgi:hypothetical protein